MRKLAAIVAIGAFTFFAANAQASHFRGGAMVPSVNASGLLTVQETSFWRPTFVATLSTPTVTNGAFLGATAAVQNTSDSRFTVVTRSYTYQLNAGSGLYSIASASCCRVGGIQNGGSNGSWQMDSAIFWDGSSANNPINFSFNAIQPEVVRGSIYADNVGAAAGNAGTISYNDNLNNNGGTTITQTPGFSINATTGAMFIDAVSTATLGDNTGGNDGADYIFSGNILNTDGSFVEFDWMFDAVDIGPVVNLAPVVSDHVINAIVGQTVNQVVTGTDNVDSIAENVTLSLLSFSGPGQNLTESFVPGAAGDPTSGTFTWDTTGSTPGVYLATIQGSDGSLTGSGQITINLSPASVPTPAAIFAAMPMLAGLIARRRDR